MDILIIGNGFDIAHGLETTYCDFLSFYNKPEFEEYKENLPIYKECLRTNLWMKHFINNQNNINGKNWIDLEQEIFDVIVKLNRLHLETLFSDPYGYLINAVNLLSNEFNFDQIEELIKPYDHSVHGYKDLVEQGMLEQKGYGLIIGKPYGDSFCIFIQNFNSFINFLYDQLRDFTKAFKEYLIKFVLFEKRNNENNLVIRNNYTTGQHLFVLNFNYTNICEKLYAETEWRRGFNIETIHMHGDINNNENCNLVLGSKSFNDFGVNINPAYNIFQKHNQRHKYGTIEVYQNFYLETIPRLSDKIDFHVVGHSLDESDEKILKHIFNSKKKSIIYIYYHTEEAHQRLINNITRIITEDEVTARVRFVKQDDPERGILQKNKHSVVSSMN